MSRAASMDRAVWKRLLADIGEIMVRSMREGAEPGPPSLDLSVESDTAAAFGRALVLEGNVLSEAPLAIPCLVKHLRLAMVDLLMESRETVSSDDWDLRFLQGFFDRMELGVFLGQAESAEGLPEGKSDGLGPLFEFMPDGVAILDRSSDGASDYMFGAVNESFQSITGVRDSELLGRPLEDVLPELFGRSHGALPQVLVNGDTVQTEVYSERLGGHYQLTMFPFFKDRATIVLSDISDRRNLEDERQRRHRLESMGRLAEELAHRFNNLMMGVTGSISMALEMLGEGEAGNHLSKALGKAEEARSTLSSLLTFASGGAPHSASMELGGLVQSAAELALASSPVRLLLRLGDRPVRATVDPAQISQAVNCIAQNARDAMPEGGSLEVELRIRPGPDGADSGMATISFADSGPGLREDEYERVFYPNYTTRDGRSGLGLTVARSIARRHGGDLRAGSGEGGGALFTLTIPLAGSLASSEDHPDSPSERSDPPLVLVMDDDDMVRQVTSGMLIQMGCRVREAADGESALAMVEESDEDYDLVIADLTVPGGRGGVWLAGELVKSASKARIVASSGYHSDAAMSRYREHGFHGVIPKPYGMDELSRLLSDVCGYSPQEEPTGRGVR